MENVVLFKNSFLIDGKGGDPSLGAIVTVVGDTIREVTDRESPINVPEARIIDLKGKTLMPGLIDAHAHPGNIEMNLERVLKHPPAVFVHKVTRILQEDLTLGFTTLRDAGGLDWGFRAAVDEDLIRGPRLKLSVAPLTQTGGHGDKRGKVQDVVLPRNTLGVYPAVCDGPEEVRKAARDMLRRGADQIKVMADGGVLSPTGGPGNWQFSITELVSAVETAEAAGTYVMAHAYTSRAVQNCLQAGVRSIEHATLIDDETVQMLRAKETFLVPTLTVFEVLARKGRGEGMDDVSLQKLKKVHDGAYHTLEIAYRAGVRIGSGSDLLGPFQNLKGREIARKAEIMGSMGAIVAATRTNAELMGISSSLGTIESGKKADLIIVDGNPLDDPSLFERGHETVVLVMKGGKIMKDIL